MSSYAINGYTPQGGNQDIQLERKRPDPIYEYIEMPPEYENEGCLQSPCVQAMKLVIILGMIMTMFRQNFLIQSQQAQIVTLKQLMTTKNGKFHVTGNSWIAQMQKNDKQMIQKLGNFQKIVQKQDKQITNLKTQIKSLSAKESKIDKKLDNTQKKSIIAIRKMRTEHVRTLGSAQINSQNLQKFVAAQKKKEKALRASVKKIDDYAKKFKSVGKKMKALPAAQKSLAKKIAAVTGAMKKNAQANKKLDASIKKQGGQIKKLAGVQKMQEANIKKEIGTVKSLASKLPKMAKQVKKNAGDIKKLQKKVGK